MKKIEVKNISFKYPRGAKIFDNYTVSFESNNIYAIVGRNGAGKTTLGKLILKLLPLDSGDVLINGVNIKNMTLGEIGKKIGYVYQDPSKQLFATTVYEELAFPLEMKNAENINETVIKQLESFDLLHLKDKFPFFLSQGEKQRLVIAGILIEKPNFLILDEPTTSLDVKRKEELKKMLIDLKENYNIGIIIISHDHDFLNALSPLEVRIEK